MTKFVYKFDSIKKIKETLEKKVRKELSVLDKEIEMMNNRMNSILNEIDYNSKSLLSRKNIKASEVQFQLGVENLLLLDAAKVRTEINKLENQKKIKLHELLEKSKEHKMFETLEDKYLENFISEQNQLEQKITDEIAVIKYIREDQ